MELTALHKAVRGLVREGRVDAEAAQQLSASKPRAVEALKRRLDKVGGKLENVLPVTGPLSGLGRLTGTIRALVFVARRYERDGYVETGTHDELTGSRPGERLVSELPLVAEYARSSIAKASDEEALRFLLTTLMSLPGRILNPKTSPKFALFVLEINRVLAGNPAAAVSAAAAVEFAIVATDVVDDLVDDEWDTSLAPWSRALNATLALNWLAHRCAVDTSAQLGEPRRCAVGDMIARGMLAACAGEDLDLALESVQAVSEEQAHDMTRRKSGSLVAMACQVGAAVATDDAIVLEKFGEFGSHVGVIAQLANDLAGVDSDTSDRGSDLRLRKKTIPIVYTLRCAYEDKLTDIIQLYETRSSLTAEQEERLADAVERLGGFHYTWVLANAHRREALGLLRELADATGRQQVLELRHLVPRVSARRLPGLRQNTMRVLQWTSSKRWWIVAVISVVLVGLADLSLIENTRQPWLGVLARRDTDQLVVAWVQPAGWAWDAGVRPGHEVLAVNGNPVTAADEPSLVNHAATIQVRSASGDVISAPLPEAGVPTSLLHQLSFITIAVCFLMVGGCVFVLASDVTASTILLGLSVTASATLFAALAIPSGANWALIAEIIGLVIFGVMTFLLFLVFPVNRLSNPLGLSAAAVSIVSGVILALVYVWTYFANPEFYAVLRSLLFVVLAANFVGAIFLVCVAVLQTSSKQQQARRTLSLVALGTIAAFAPLCLLSLVPYVIGRGYLVAPDLSILSLVLFPASIGGAVLSRQFLGIERLVRRGLVALTVWISMVAAYSIVLAPLRAGSSDNPLWVIASATPVKVAIVTGTFPLIEARLRRWLEQLLFRNVYDYRQVVQQMGSELSSLSGVDAVAEHSLERLGQTLDLSWAAIELLDEPAAPLVYRWGACPASLDIAPSPAEQLEPQALPARSSTSPLSVNLVAEGVVIGRLIVGPKQRDIELSADDQTLVASLAPLVATSLQNGLLLTRLKDKVVSLGERERDLAALSLQLMNVQEEERRRLALDLHDDPLQRAIFLARDLQRTDDPLARRWLKAVEEIILSLRAICTDLRPPVLDDFGLVAGLQKLVSEVRARANIDASFVATTVDGEPVGRLQPEVEIALYRVAQEALNNCLKHAEASRVSVRLSRDDTWVHLEVADDGRGYATTPSGDRKRDVHLGLVSMRERLRPCNGILTMTTGGKGGTVVSARVPLRGSNGRAD